MECVTKKNELYHHGVKGQKWGVRRYQNKDGSLTSEGRKHNGYVIYGDGRIEIDKGTKLQRLVGKDSKQDLNGISYASFTKNDNAKYIDYIGGKGLFGGGRDTKLTLTAKTTLKSPSTQEATKELFTLFKTNKQFRDQYANSALGINYKDKQIDEFIKDPNSKKAKEAYSGIICYFGFNSSKNIRQAYFDQLSSKGYNMLRDENDVASGLTKNPIILFDANKSVSLEKAEKITDAMRKDARTLTKANKKAGKKYLREHGFESLE